MSLKEGFTFTPREGIPMLVVHTPDLRAEISRIAPFTLGLSLGNTSIRGVDIEVEASFTSFDSSTSELAP